MFNVWCPTFDVFINPRMATTIQTFLSLLSSSCPLDTLLLPYILLTAGPLCGPPVKNVQISGVHDPGPVGPEDPTRYSVLGH